jgi:hypothetical protein
MLDNRQRHARKRFQDPLRRWLVGPLLLVLRMQTWEAGLRCLERPSQDKLRDRSYTHTKRQQVREALNLVVQLDKQRRDMDAALEAVEDAFNTVCVPIYRGRDEMKL